MISGYEIRENTVTQNSVFLLLLKADEAGRKQVEDKLSAFCTLTKLQMKGFDYVFELSGITDDSMLEKFRNRLDFISSSVAGVTETFANPVQTETITLEKSKTMPTLEIPSGNINKTFEPEINLSVNEKADKSSMPTLDIFGDKETPSLKLSEEGFPVSQEKPVTELKDLNYNHNLSGDEMTEISVEGDSLKVKEEDLNAMPSIPPSAEPQSHIMPAVEKEKRLSVEEENQPVVAFSEKELQNVAISIERPKKSIFGGIFNKFKDILNSKKAKSQGKEKEETKEKETEVNKEENTLSDQPKKKLSLFQKAKNLKDKVAESDLIKQAQEKAKELQNEIKQEIKNDDKTETPVKEEPKNPFQDLGSGIIVKKGLLSDDPLDDVIKREKDDLFSNPITAKIKVDDIFAAETVYDFYADHTESKNIDFEQDHQKEITLGLSEKQPKKQEKETKIEKEEIKEEKEANPLQKEESAVKQEKPEIVSKQEKIVLAPSEEQEIEIKNIFEQPNQKEDAKKQEENIEDNSEKKEKGVVKERTPVALSEEKQEIEIKKDDTSQQNQEVQEKEDIKKLIAKESSEDIAAKYMDDLGSVFREKTQKQETMITFSEVEKEEKKRKEQIKKQAPVAAEKETKHTAQENKATMPLISEKAGKSPQENDLKKENIIMEEQNIENQNIVKGDEVLGKSFTSKNNATKRKDNIDHTLHVGTPAKGTKYRNYPIEMPLIPTYTFANMDISPMRFAHAMAMSTLDNLGTSNNPFLLQGISGTGKTHFLHAMGYEISKQIPQSKILFTNGVRFSRGIQYSLEKGQKEKLDSFFKGMEVLIIDDIHLTAVNEHNREYISKILNDFLRDKKQIILSSKYPPESLQRFEELVNFKFALGTITELKVPNRTHFTRLVNKMVSSSNLELSENQVQEFFCDRCSSLGDVARDIKRVKVLSRRIESSGIKTVSFENILKMMTGINGENEESEIVKKNFEDITVLDKNTKDNWGNFGFFFPASQIDKFRWVAFASQEAAKELGIKGGFNYALKSAYSTEHIISAAFKIANICDVKGLKGAVILGPSLAETKEPIRDNFYDILTHMLEVMMIRCGTINFENIKKPSSYIKMLGDILK